jgi:hypothetical protein
MRSTGKAALGGVGLLSLARRARDAVTAVGWLRHNRRFLRGGGGGGLPVPSTRLRTLTTASPSIEWFVESGREAADSIREQLERHRVPIAKIDQLLDFGSGCGPDFVVCEYAPRGARGKPPQDLVLLQAALHGLDAPSTVVAPSR